MITQYIKSWLTGNDSRHSRLYSSWYGKKNANAIYAPGLDRFLLVDNFDLWLTMEVARILSSKIPTQVFLLGKDVPEFDNTNCFETTIIDKRKYVINGSNILTARQVPSLHVLMEPDSVANVGIPRDYQTGTHKKMLDNLKSYSLFVLRNIHAITIADSIKNITPFEDMIKTYLPDHIPDVKLPQDQSVVPNGIKNEIKSILYQSQSVKEALERIETVWFDYGYNLPGYRNMYYYYMGLDIPQRLKEQEINSNQFTPRAV